MIRKKIFGKFTTTGYKGGKNYFLLEGGNEFYTFEQMINITLKREKNG